MSSGQTEYVKFIVEAVQSAGRELRRRFPPLSRPRSLGDIETRIGSSDAVSLDVLRPGLERAKPGVNWVGDELDEGALPAGEWWVVDPIEGAINYVHGMTEWCVTATLVRDNQPSIAAVYVPLSDELYVAVRGEGTTRNGDRLTVSAKTDLGGALVGSGQASPRDSDEMRDRLGSSVSRMLHHSLTTRMSVPSTWQMIQVAAGRMEAFWQFSSVRSGLCAGALLVREAGGIVTDVHGRPWALGSADCVASAPGVHGQVLGVLAASG